MDKYLTRTPRTTNNSDTNPLRLLKRPNTTVIDNNNVAGSSKMTSHELSNTNKSSKIEISTKSDKNLEDIDANGIRNSTFSSNNNSGENLQIITGSVKKIIMFHNGFPLLNALYEVFSRIIGFKNGTNQMEKIILMRNDNGPVLQGIYYEIDLPLPELKIGSCIRCVGKFSSPTGHFQILNIREIQELNTDFILRLETITKFELTNNNDLKPHF